MTKWLPRSVFVVGVVLLGAAANSRAVIKVAKVGDPAPTSVGGTFATFLGQGPVLLGINDHGQVLFWSAISGGGNTDAGVFMSSGGVITKVVVNGDPSPLGGVFQDLPPTAPNYSLNNLGQVAFGAGVQGGAAGGGLFLFAGGAITKILVDGDPAPAPALVEPVNDPDSFVLSFGFSFHLNDSGAIAIITQQGKPAPFGAHVSVGALYLAAGGAITRLVAGGLGTAVGRLTLSGPTAGPVLNNKLQVALVTSTDQSPEVVFVCTTGSCQKVVAAGDTVPGGTWGAHAGPCCLLDLNDRGEVGLFAGPPLNELLRWPGGLPIQKIVAAGDAVPMPVGGVFTGVGPGAGFAHPGSLNDLSDVVFRGLVDGGTAGVGAFVIANGVLVVGAAAGDPAPGGVLSASDFAGNVLINNPGCIAFQASLDGVAQPEGLWLADAEPVTLAKSRRFWGDLDDHSLPKDVKEGRGDVLLGQIYGEGTNAVLVAKLSKDVFDAFFNYAGLAITNQIRALKGLAVPVDDRVELADRLAKVKAGALDRLSRLQLEVIRKHWNACDGTIDFGKLQKATEMFANGELRTGAPGQREMDVLMAWIRWTTFATTAIDAGVNKDDWEKILPILVEGAEIYRRVYPPRAPITPRENFYRDLETSSAERFDGTKQLTEDEKVQLRSDINQESPAQVRDRLTRFIDSATIQLGLAPPRSLKFQFANVTADPMGTGFFVHAEVDVTDDAGRPVTDANLVILADEVGIAPPPGTFSATPTPTNQGSGAYSVDFASPVADTELALFAFEPEPPVVAGCATDVSGSIQLTRSGYSYNFTTGRFYQTVTLINFGSSVISAPISLVLDNLSSNATLSNAAGATVCTSPLGSPFITVSGPLTAGAAASGVLQFVDPTKTRISYTTRVLAGSGSQ